MRITIVTVTGFKFYISLDKGDTILTIKESILKLYKFPLKYQIIKKGETEEELEDKVVIGEVFEEKEGTLDLRIKETDEMIDLWGEECEEEGTKEMRMTMVNNLKYFSVFKKVIKKEVLEAMKIDSHEEEDELVVSYTYSRPMAASPTSVESSPEVIAAMLSLVKVKPSMRVCVFGIKGGYIQSLMSEMAKLGGKVVVFSSDSQSFEYVQKRAEEKTPLFVLQKWILVDDLENVTQLKTHGPFDCIFFCGSVPKIGEKFTQLLDDGGELIAPVGRGRMQRLQILRKTGEKIVAHTVQEWGVVFSQIK